MSMNTGQQFTNTGQKITNSGRTIVPVVQKNQLAADQLSAMTQAADNRRQLLQTKKQNNTITVDETNELTNLMNNLSMGGRRKSKRRRTNKRRSSKRRRTLRRRH